MKEITIEYLVNLLLRRLVIIILVAIIFAAAAFGYCRFVATPVYKATAQLVVSNGAVIIEDALNDDGSKISGNDIQSSVYLADFCADLLETQEFNKKLAEKLENKYSYGELGAYISAYLVHEESLFINISVSHGNPAVAKKIANTTAAMAPDYLKEILPSAKIMMTATADSAGKVSPRTMMTTALYGMIGAVLVYIIALIVDLNDKTIKGVASLTEEYNISILGTVPDFENTDLQGGYSYAETK